jgi:hypothetical protein
MAFVKGIGKVLGPIGVIFSIFDGISTATDTAKLQSIFGKFDITMQDRISGFVGGFIGGFGGLFDLLAKLMGIEIEGESIQSSLTKTVTLMTDSIFEGIKSFLLFIGKILTSEPAKAVFGAAQGLFSVVADGIGAMFKFLKDVFFSDAFQKVISILGTIAGEAISGVINAITSIVEIVVGLFTLDFTKVKGAVGDLVGTVANGIKNAFTMLADGIIWAINGLMDALKLPSSWRLGYFNSGFNGDTQIQSEAPRQVTQTSTTGTAPTSSMSQATQQTLSPATPAAEPTLSQLTSSQAYINARRSGQTAQQALQTAKNSFTQSATTSRTGVVLNSQGRSSSIPASAYYEATPPAVQPATVPISSVAVGNEGKLPLSIRNNNPGNLRFYESLTKPGYVLEGAVRGEGGFAAFPTPEAGLNAMRRQLIIDTQRNGKTVSEMLNKYAPASENDTAKYIEFVGKQTGLGPNDRVPADAIPSLMRSMVTMEGGRTATDFYYGGSSAAAPQEKREAEKTVQAVQVTATETVAIRRANEDQSETLSSLASDFENSTDIQQAQLVNLDAYHKQSLAEAELLRSQQKAQFDAEQKFLQERKNLELQFLREVEGDIRGAMTKALGPAGMGVSGQNANMMAYRTYGSLLEKPFSNALTKVFGTSGSAYGQIFSRLAGSYINQAAGAILPAMGIDANLFNRALSNYTAGKQVRDQYKVAQTEYNLAKAEYDGAAAKVTLADRMNATRPNGVSEVKRLQIAKVDALESALQQKGVTLKKAGEAKDANRAMYTEDLMFALTGMPTGIRSMMGYETGMDQMTRQLTMMIGGDIAQSAFGGAGLQDYMNQYRQMYDQQLQGQATVAEQTAALQGQVGVSSAEMQLAVGQQNAKVFNSVLVDHTNRLGQIMGIFTPSTSVGGGGSIPGVRGATSGGGASGRMSSNDMFGNLFGSMISNRMGVRGPAAGIISSGLGDLFSGQGFGRTAGYIQGPNTFASSLFNMYSLKNADTSTFGGALNTGLAAYQLYNALASGSIASSVGSAASSLATASGATYGTAMGSQQSMMLAGQEAGMAAAPGSGAATAGTVAGYAAGAIGGHYVGRAISSGYSTGGSGNSMVNAGTAIGAFFGGPVGALIGGAIGGTVNRLFGRRPREVTGSGLQVTMGGEAGASGQQYEDWMRKGGKYRSDKTGRDFSEIDPALLKYLNRTTKDMQESFGAIGKTMGLDENALKGFERYYDISFAGLTGAQSAEKLQEAMQTYAADMIKTQYGDVSKFAKEIIDKDTGEVRDENTLETFERLGKSAQMVDYWMRGFGITAQQTTKLLENLIPPGTASLLESFATSNDAKLQLANLKAELVEGFGGEDAFNREMSEAFNALYTNEEKAIFARDTALENVRTAFEKIEVPAEIQELIDSFGLGEIKTAEDVEEARLAYRAAIAAATEAGDRESFTQLTIAGDQFMEAANMSLQAAQMNKDNAERTKTADEFFGFTAVEDFSMGIANGIAEAAPQMSEGPTSMFDLGSENLTGVVDRSFVAPYYGDGTPISGLVSNAGAGGLGGQGTIVLQPSVIDNSVMSNPSTNIYMDNSAVRDYHPILSIDVRNVTSGYLGLGSK